ncbi:hypothetical protein M1M88_01355 [Peptococcaceae bacterium]|nr:hypothetical protein [Peptococcaceae bacterium]
MKLIDIMEDKVWEHNKVTRIWGKTKGQATKADRILILSKGTQKNLTLKQK